MNYQIEFDQTNNTNIALGTTADYAYILWLAKQKQIAELEYECGLLVDKYHYEMQRGCLPMQFSESFLTDLFDKDMKRSRLARKHFLTLCFTGEFLKKHKVTFVTYVFHGHRKTAISIVLDIGDYQYTVEIPIPRNIVKPEDQTSLMGKVKFRVDRIHKSKAKEFVRKMESVQIPTYDWKACFKAIEQKEGVND